MIPHDKLMGFEDLAALLDARAEKPNLPRDLQKPERPLSNQEEVWHAQARRGAALDG